MKRTKTGLIMALGCTCGCGSGLQPGTVVNLAGLLFPRQVAGEDGADGLVGLDGANGSPGVDGASGLDGEQGATGPQGDQGTQGPPGRDGVDGQNCPEDCPIEWCHIHPGPPGQHPVSVPCEVDSDAD